ncbi:glycine zipper domain-containing protein [Rubrivivax benzoatilyticus]|uniref:Uncharacterized protein n=1 Tax=Rubrivivax benzoatilyticus TaxID=316997 RepID=A0ABX0HT53_9BURK|nr:glycine zipper domain-containing protein [Rubrivivax benzoatilyticus]EGJ11964.1 hypothetical protein RBXJA2T_16617 [Rubrivivax benzoatilyticus JA2 = ATCC BAA-35]NHK97486.1 hypothetical protein [Rubrivivax benzoatilyticus]NHL22819.1 hypothetical protein [Rubrivivax benzoatilyticus]
MNDRIKSDASGLLVGTPIDTTAEEDSELLGDIRDNTGKILDVLQRRPDGHGTSSRQPVAPVSRSADRAARAPSVDSPTAPRKIATPVPRSERAWGYRNLARGEDRRFAPRRGADTSSAADSRAAGAVARSAEQMARTAEAARKDAKADARRDQARDARGRFGGGQKDGSGVIATVGRLAGGLTSGAGAAVTGVERIDPIVGAAAEVRDVVAPLGRAASYFAGRRRERDDPSVPWLRKLWREIRGARRDDAATARSMQRGLKDVKDAAGAARGESGGLLSAIGSLLPAAVAPVIATVAGIGTKISGMLGGIRAALSKLPLLGPTLASAGDAEAAKAATSKPGGLRGLLGKLPLIGTIATAALALAEDRRIANDAGLTDDERARKRAENVGGFTGAVGGASAGAAFGTMIAPGPGTLVGGVLGAYLGSKAGEMVGEKAGQLGWVSERFESGGRGVGTISSGRGDRGGVSYGKHQLATNTGTMAEFLRWAPEYGAQFAGLTPGTPEFNAKYRQVVERDEQAFGDAQRRFMIATHYEPEMAKLKAAGFDLSGRGASVREAVFSTATQFRGDASKIIAASLKGRDLASMTDAQITDAIQDRKIQFNDAYFRSSSPAVRASQLHRAMSEKELLRQAAVPSVASPAVARSTVQVTTAYSPTVPRVPAVAAVPPAPTVEPIPERVSSSAPAPTTVVAQAPLTQDVRDRSIAHICCGGIGSPTTHYH